MYVVLKRLESNSLVSAYWDDSESGGEIREYYQITEVGIGYLNKKRLNGYFLRVLWTGFLRRFNA